MAFEVRCPEGGVHNNRFAQLLQNSARLLQNAARQLGLPLWHQLFTTPQRRARGASSAAMPLFTGLDDDGNRSRRRRDGDGRGDAVGTRFEFTAADDA